jgi:hypothetical protein
MGIAALWLQPNVNALTPIWIPLVNSWQASSEGSEGCRVGVPMRGGKVMTVRPTPNRGLRKTHLQEVATATAMDLSRLHDWFEGRSPTTTRRSRFAQLPAA